MAESVAAKQRGGDVRAGEERRSGRRSVWEANLPN